MSCVHAWKEYCTAGVCTHAVTHRAPMLHTCKLCAALLMTYYTKGHFHCPSLLGIGHTRTCALVLKPCDQDWQGGHV